MPVCADSLDISILRHYLPPCLILWQRNVGDRLGGGHGNVRTTRRPALAQPSPCSSCHLATTVDEEAGTPALLQPLSACLLSSYLPLSVCLSFYLSTSSCFHLSVCLSVFLLSSCCLSTEFMSGDSQVWASLHIELCRLFCSHFGLR